MTDNVLNPWSRGHRWRYVGACGREGKVHYIGSRYGKVYFCGIPRLCFRDKPVGCSVAISCKTCARILAKMRKKA